MMLQEIGSHTFDIEYKNKEIDGADYVMAIDKAHILTNPETEDLFIYEEIAYMIHKSDLIYGFAVDGVAVYLLPEIPEELIEWAKLVEVRAFAPERPEIRLAGATAMHLFSWYRSHKFCGCCGKKLVHDSIERAMVCKECGHMSFPQICPAIIVGVIDRDNDKILLTRSARRHNAIFSLIAGFTEIGETLEQTCAREAFEEVGVKIKNVTPFVDQPWGFSSSLMIGFFAELDGSGDFTLQEDEIAEARWFSREEMPAFDSPIDITHHMMEMWRTGKVK